MGLFGNMMNNYFYGKAGKGDYRIEDMPQNRFQLFGEVLKVRWSAMIGVNLLYIVSWLPAAAWTIINLMMLDLRRSAGRAGLSVHVSADSRAVHRHHRPLLRGHRLRHAQLGARPAQLRLERLLGRGEGQLEAGAARVGHQRRRAGGAVLRLAVLRLHGRKIPAVLHSHGSGADDVRRVEAHGNGHLHHDGHLRPEVQGSAAQFLPADHRQAAAGRGREAADARRAHPRHRRDFRHPRRGALCDADFRRAVPAVHAGVQSPDSRPPSPTPCAKSTSTRRSRARRATSACARRTGTIPSTFPRTTRNNRISGKNAASEISKKSSAPGGAPFGAFFMQRSVQT